MTTTTASSTEVLAERATRARKLIGTANRKAAKVAGDPEISSPSTRARHALKLKAEALDQVGAILAGKD